MINDRKIKFFSILFLLFGMFYMIMIVISVLQNNLGNAIFCAVSGVIVFFICFSIASESKRLRK